MLAPREVNVEKIYFIWFIETSLFGLGFKKWPLTVLALSSYGREFQSGYPNAATGREKIVKKSKFFGL
jgi:hypothetical protein